MYIRAASRVFSFAILTFLMFSLLSTDVLYASPGPYLRGCEGAIRGAVWQILAIVDWVDAGTGLRIIVDLYRVYGGDRVGRIEDNVSGSGSKTYRFDNVPGGPEDRWILDVQFMDVAKRDWVHTPNRPGTMECPRPAARTETITTTATLREEKTATVEVKATLTFGEQYWSYIVLVASLIALILGAWSTKLSSLIRPGGPKPASGPSPRGPRPGACGTPCTCMGPDCDSTRGAHCPFQKAEGGFGGGCGNNGGWCDLPAGHEYIHHCVHGHNFHR